MIKTTKKIIKFIINKFFLKKKYPYIFEFHESTITNRKIKFNINHPIEEYRLRFWGDEKDYVLKVINEIRSNDIFLDIGSSVGLFSVLASFKAVNGLVISIEPDQENMDSLIRNFDLNDNGNFIECRLAAGTGKGRLKLFTNGSNDFSPSLKPVNGINNEVEIDVDSIDNLISNRRIPCPNVVKIDIEGAEFLALSGMRNLLQSENRPRIIFVEIHPDFLDSFDTSVNEIFEFMEYCGYCVKDRILRDSQLLCEFVVKSKI